VVLLLIEIIGGQVQPFAPANCQGPGPAFDAAQQRIVIGEIVGIVGGNQNAVDA
jgi:hypothetical protein